MIFVYTLNILFFSVFKILDFFLILHSFEKVEAIFNFINYFLILKFSKKNYLKALLCLKKKYFFKIQNPLFITIWNFDNFLDKFIFFFILIFGISSI